MRKQLPSDKTKSMVEFSTQKPHERFESIRRGAEQLQYGQSEYIRQFGMNINTAGGPLALQGRILPTPALQYGRGSREPTVVRYFFIRIRVRRVGLSCFFAIGAKGWEVEYVTIQFRFRRRGAKENFFRADKKLVAPMSVNHWLIVTFENRRFREPGASEMVKNLIKGFESTGKRNSLILFLGKGGF